MPVPQLLRSFATDNFGQIAKSFQNQFAYSPAQIHKVRPLKLDQTMQLNNSTSVSRWQNYSVKKNIALDFVNEICQF